MSKVIKLADVKELTAADNLGHIKELLDVATASDEDTLERVIVLFPEVVK